MKKHKRARTKKGHYKGDDKSTPFWNEAWVKGKSDYIAFKRIKYPWLVVNRQQLWEMLEAKLKERNYSPSLKPWYEKEAYATYDRSYFGKKDKFCWVPYEDIEQLADIKKL